MLVAQILKTKGDMVFTVGPDETLRAAAALLAQRAVGAMVVKGAEDRVAGILSERDVAREVGESGPAALERTVGEVMTRDVLFAEPGHSVDQLLSLMTDRRVRHLPVCREGRLIGIVSIGDLVKVKIAEVEAEAADLKAYISAG